MADKIFPTGYSDLSGSVTSTSSLYVDDGSANGYIPISKVAEVLDVESISTYTTVNLNSSLTTAQIQTLIDAAPKRLNGNTLVFQFADGTYTLNSNLTFYGFVGGQIRIQGNGFDTFFSTTKSVHLNFSTGSAVGIIVQHCSAVDLTNLRITPSASVGDAIYVNECGAGYVGGCYISGGGYTGASGVNLSYTAGTVASTYLSNVTIGIYASNCLISSVQNDDTGTPPNYGLSCNGGTICKSSTQPAGATGNELTAGGGVIR